MAAGMAMLLQDHWEHLILLVPLSTPDGHAPAEPLGKPHCPHSPLCLCAGMAP